MGQAGEFGGRRLRPGPTSLPIAPLKVLLTGGTNRDIRGDVAA